MVLGYEKLYGETLKDNARDDNKYIFINWINYWHKYIQKGAIYKMSTERIEKYNWSYTNK